MKLICANFKMNLLKKDINLYLKKINNNLNNKKVIFFPSNIYIKDFHDKNYLVGAQDISFQEFGACTGDTSILQLKELGITYTLIGHSERRQFFNDDLYISKKIALAAKHKIKIILCIGESIEEFKDNKTLEILKKEIDLALKNNLKYLTTSNIIIAYEPIWAIGTNKIPTNLCIQETISLIKKYIFTTYNLKVKVLYGGSVNENNILELEKIKNIDGYLIGSSSLNPDNFLTLINKIN